MNQFNNAKEIRCSGGVAVPVNPYKIMSVKRPPLPFDQDDAIDNNSLHDQFKTWLSQQPTLYCDESLDAKLLLGRSSLRNDEPGKTIYVLGAKFGANWQLHQSSQPQQNAISVIEEKLKELDRDYNDMPNHAEGIALAIREFSIVLNRLNQSK